MVCGVMLPPSSLGISASYVRVTRAERGARVAPASSALGSGRRAAAKLIIVSRSARVAAASAAANWLIVSDERSPLLARCVGRPSDGPSGGAISRPPVVWGASLIGSAAPVAGVVPSVVANRSVGPSSGSMALAACWASMSPSVSWPACWLGEASASGALPVTVPSPSEGVVIICGTDSSESCAPSPSRAVSLRVRGRVVEFPHRAWHSLFHAR